MRLIEISVVLPVLSLVSASLTHDARERGLHVRSPSAGHGHGHGHLIARQRSSGVLDPLIGDEDETTTSPTTSATSTQAVGPTRSPVTTTPDDDVTSPTTSPTAPTVTPPISSTSRTSSTSSTESTEEEPSSTSSSSMSQSIAETNTTSSEPSTSSESASAEPSTSLSVDAGGETVVVTVMQSVVTESVSRSSVPASATPTVKEKEDDNNGLAIPLGAVIGISIGAGLVVLLLIGLAVWRMKKRSVDEDEAIRWPELNRHGDSDAHHALPAVQTGKHGIEDGPLERSISNSSSLFHHSSVAPAYDASSAPMPLNGSTFGASSSPDDEYYQEKSTGMQSQHDPYGAHSHPYDLDTDYTSYPPAIQQNGSNPGVNGPYDLDSDDETRHTGSGAGGGGHVTYPVYR